MYIITTRDEKCTFTYSEPNQTKADKDKVFVEFMGHDGHGRVRTYGSGASLTNIFGPSSSSIGSTTPSDKIQQIVESTIATRMT